MNSPHHKQDTDFVVKCQEKDYVYKLSDIVRLEAKSNYTVIHSTRQRPVVVAKALAAYERLLCPSHFLRVHRSHLINPDYVHSFSHKGRLVLYDRLEIEIPRRKKKSVAERLNFGGA